MAKDKDKGNGKPDEAAAPTEGAETAPEATTAGTEAPKAEKPAGPSPEELLANLRSAVTAAISGADDEGVLPEASIEPLQTAYRKIPAARRGNVQAEILKDAMTAPGVNHKAVASVLEQMTKAPESKPRATRAAKPEVPAHISLAQSLSALDVARLTLIEGVDAEIVAQATALAEASLNGGIEEEETRESVIARAAKAVNAVRTKARKSGGGQGGPRTPKTEGLTQLVERGDLKAGDVLKSGERTATVVMVEGVAKLDVAGTVCDNPTAAAKQAGVTSSVNGWAFWNAPNGKPVGDLRKA